MTPQNLTTDLKLYYNSLTEKQKKYVLYRAQGLSRQEAYSNAGYSGTHGKTNGYIMETRDNPRMPELIDALSGNVPQMIRTPVPGKIEPPPTELVETIKPSVPENAEKSDWEREREKNLAFYRKVANGSIKTVKKTMRYNADGVLTGTTVEEVDDVDIRIKAQKEVMRLQGAADIVEIGKVQANAINVMIVDASKKEQAAELPKTEVINGETVIVEEREERESGKKRKKSSKQ